WNRRSICSAIRSSTCSPCSPCSSPTVGSHSEDRGGDRPPAARAGAGHGVASGGFRHPAFLHHPRQDGDELVTAVAQKNMRTARWMALLVAAMVGLAFASPALYRTFCSLTGFGGTPLRAEQAPGAVAGQVGVR